MLLLLSGVPPNAKSELAATTDTAIAEIIAIACSFLLEELSIRAIANAARLFKKLSKRPY
jgi:hypothetical protein